MAVRATGQVTISVAVDVSSVTRYYLLQASTLAPPAKPTTANPPGGSWAATEPTYAEGSTNSLYTCDLTVFSDGTHGCVDAVLPDASFLTSAALLLPLLALLTLLLVEPLVILDDEIPDGGGDAHHGYCRSDR